MTGVDVSVVRELVERLRELGRELGTLPWMPVRTFVDRVRELRVDAEAACERAERLAAHHPVVPTSSASETAPTFMQLVVAEERYYALDSVGRVWFRFHSKPRGAWQPFLHDGAVSFESIAPFGHLVMAMDGGGVLWWVAGHGPGATWRQA